MAHGRAAEQSTLAQPARDPGADLDADPRRKNSRGHRCREIDLPEAAFSGQLIQPIGPFGLGGVDVGTAGRADGELSLRAVGILAFSGANGS